MTGPVVGKQHFTKRFLIPALVLLAFATGAAVAIKAQTAHPTEKPNHPSPVAQWEKAAGGKMVFEVASVKASQPDGWHPPDFPLDSGDAFVDIESGSPPRGRFSAVFPLAVFIEFAYKLPPASEQAKSLRAGLPRWADSDDFEIEARAQGNPTKDQMRLMMQSLLTDRFSLAIHFETREEPVFALALVKPGQPGPKLRPHVEGAPCDAPNRDTFPQVCGVYNVQGTPDRPRWGSRNTTMELLAAHLSARANFGRPIVDRTALANTWDFSLEWTEEPDPSFHEVPRTLSKNGSNASRSNGRDPERTALDGSSPTLREALRQQLGLKLVPTKAAIRLLLVDHVERPSPN